MLLIKIGIPKFQNSKKVFNQQAEKLVNLGAKFCTQPDRKTGDEKRLSRNNYILTKSYF